MSSPYKVIHTTEALGAVGPYSQAVVHNGIAYCSGCIPFTTDMKLVEGGIEAQTEQSLNNLFAVLKAAGSDPSVSAMKEQGCEMWERKLTKVFGGCKQHVLKCTVFMKDMNDFVAINVSVVDAGERKSVIGRGVLTCLLSIYDDDPLDDVDETGRL